MSEEFFKTDWSMDKATLMRIDDALKMAATASFRDDYMEWFKALSFLRREAIVKMKPPEIEECNMMFRKLENFLAYLESNKALKTQSVFTQADNRLDEFEIYLRGIMNERGMLLKDRDDMRGL